MRLMQKRKVTLIGIFMVIAAMGFVAIGAVQAQAAEFWKEKYERFSARAGETLATGDVVCIVFTDSFVYKASSSTDGRRPAVGVIGKGGVTGDTVEVVTRGILAGQDRQSPGAMLWLGETPGEISPEISPAAVQAIGWVIPETSGADQSTIFYISVTINTDAVIW